MREIKLRAWSEPKGKMLLGSELNEKLVRTYTEDGKSTELWLRESVFTSPDIRLMQYTGLKDKNGKEIYEGDIIRGPSNTSVVLETAAKSNRQIMANFEVRWSEHQFWGSWVLRPLSKVHRTYPPFSLCEVIGNIYENPELLKDRQGK